MLRFLAGVTIFTALQAAVHAQGTGADPQPQSGDSGGSTPPSVVEVSPDSPWWELQGRAGVAEFLGRRC